MDNKQNGFTLVELAIALMVIGLLIGGVLKGQELIQNARITRVVKDLNDFDTAAMIFRTTYNALPGDIRQPTRLPNCNADPCNNTTDVGTGQLDSPIKRANFWRHLDRAGLIHGINDAATRDWEVSPVNSFDGHFGVTYWINSNAAYYNARKNALSPFDPAPAPSPTNYSLIKVTSASAIDSKMDDGNPETGTVHLLINPSMLANCRDSATGTYVKDRQLRCQILVSVPSLN